MGLEQRDNSLNLIDHQHVDNSWDDISTGLYNPDILDDYLQIAKQVPLITDKQIEYNLIHDVHMGIEARQQLTLAGYPHVDLNEFQHLHEMTRQGEQSLIHLQMANSKLILSIVKKYYGIPFPDRYQEGALGLTLSIQRFNFDKNVRLSTWATYYIRRFISKAVQSNRRTIRVPRETSVLLRRFHNAKQLLTQEFGHVPTDEEICARFPEFSPNLLKQLAPARYKIRRLNKPLRDDKDDYTLEDTIADDVNIEDQARYSELVALVENAGNYLSPRELRAITLHYIDGLAYEDMRCDPVFTKEDGTQCNRKRVHQITQNGVMKLRIALKGRGITAETLSDFLE